MLIISRKKDQKIVIADEIEITILEVGRSRVRFGIQAPKHIHIQTQPTSTLSLVQKPSQPVQAMDEIQLQEPIMPAAAGSRRTG